MKLEQSIADYAEFNAWANIRLVHWLQQNPQELITRNTMAISPSIKASLEHMLHTQLFYLTTIKDLPYERMEPQSLDALYNGIINQSQELASYVRHRNAYELCKAYEVKGKSYNGSFPAYLLIQHCINHLTYYRAQVITIAHSLNLMKAPSTDYLYFHFEKQLLDEHKHA